jgi:hypothetical protein
MLAQPPTKETPLPQFTVKRGRRYQATLSLGLLESFASNDMVADRLRAAGFSEVDVEGTGASRSAQALWANDDATAEMPSQVLSVTEIEVA